MPIAAVPSYLGQDFKEASPGMRFGVYFSGWEPGFRMPKNKVPVVKSMTSLGSHAQTLTKLRDRQAAQARQLGAWIIEATATAPFTTGLGNEHPLENGFAFLNPYGLPYLPGSGVKGVVRRAAQELASGDWGDTHGWSAEKSYEIRVGKTSLKLSMLDALFGLEASDGDTQHVRGALAFWDVISQIEGDCLMVEIMTPHQSHYYQQKNERKSGSSTTPHDSGQPNPIAFLTVPPGSRFCFCVVCDTRHLARLTANRLEGTPDLLEIIDGQPRWQVLLEAAFEHAFAWLGFGAKTAVGYGAMESQAMRERRAREEAERQAEAREAEKQHKHEQAITNAVEWAGARIKFNRNNGTLTVEKDGKSANAIAPRGRELLDSLPADIKEKVETGQFVKVIAKVSGNELISVSV